LGWIKQQKGPSSGALAVEHSIPLPKQHPLVYEYVGVVRLVGSLSLTQSLIFESQPEGLHLLSQGEVTYFFKISLQTLDKRGWAPKKNFKREETHLLDGAKM
jgi:hypothetical protein